MENNVRQRAEEPAPITRRTLHDEIVTRVRDMIIEGRLAPGTRIHEGQLGQALGVSRTPLREALKFLASEGLIDLVPSRGAVVRRFTEKDVRDMLEVLAALEALAGRLACIHATDEEIAELRALHEAMIAQYAARNRLEYFKLNQRIHSAFALMSRNAVLVATHDNIQARLKRIRFLGNETPEKWQSSIAEHEEMVAALERRDADALADVLARHMHNAWERIRSVI
ncbi:GntR family transcriptional regulator [Chelatococcus sp. SYSU_G07232]|uniref:GntR family transcriptional regulator n=1 Tax=Chelatococcus albus TaxID=3047466 RepID=A0ABT7AH45_9HYPH|nr:GntR family transcriptional regulator [Chelatococcus sp. SYSU_G07232]MDJ1158663.1 GntR family transcriptional regulator [Chelatococcus sp. SYSU_G07232]